MTPAAHDSSLRLSSAPVAPVVAVIGGGPAGLMAAEVLAQGGCSVDLYDAMPSVGRKFLLAGKGGMNITHSEPDEAFRARYAERAAEVGRWLDTFDAGQLRAWVHDLGIETFVGSSGRVFPTGMKAAPLLRSWQHRLRTAGVRFHMRHRWTGWQDGQLAFDTPEQRVYAAPAATVLALGGASWPRLGSDGTWSGILAAQGVDLRPLLPSNCGFDAGWSAHFSERHAGQPLTTVAIAYRDRNGQPARRKGQCVVTATGLEGSLVYAISAPVRDQILAEGAALIHLDLLPDWPAGKVLAEVAHPRGARSLSSHLQSRLGLKSVHTGLLRECLPRDVMEDSAALAAAIKALPVKLLRTRPIEEVISSAGGVRFEALDGDSAMLAARPGVFVAGEMLDWEAPTGGYLLTACMASGRVAARDVLHWLQVARH
jgi:hypothetical protein